MEIPHELFYLTAFLFAATAVVAFFRAYREKERFYYVRVVICLLGLAWSILFVLDQVALAVLFVVVAMIFSIVMRPEASAFQDRRMEEVDIESPLRVGEFFSNTYSGWLKLACRHGLEITVILYFLRFEIFTGGMLLVLNLFYDIPSGFILSVLTPGIFLAILFYRQIKRALTTIHSPSGSPTENKSYLSSFFMDGVVVIKSGKILFNHPEGTNEDRLWATVLFYIYSRVKFGLRLVRLT